MPGSVIETFAKSVPVTRIILTNACDVASVTEALVSAIDVTPPIILSMEVKLLFTGKSQVPTSVPRIGTARLVLTVVGSTILPSLGGSYGPLDLAASGFLNRPYLNIRKFPKLLGGPSGRLIHNILGIFCRAGSATSVICCLAYGAGRRSKGRKYS